MKKGRKIRISNRTVPSASSMYGTAQATDTYGFHLECLDLGVCAAPCAQSVCVVRCARNRNEICHCVVYSVLVFSSSTSITSAHMRIKYEKDIILRNTIINHCQQMLCARNKNVYSINLMCVPLMISEWNGEFYPRISHTHTHSHACRSPHMCGAKLEYAVAF